MYFNGISDLYFFSNVTSMYFYGNEEFWREFQEFEKESEGKNTVEARKEQIDAQEVFQDLKHPELHKCNSPTAKPLELKM